MKPFKIGLISFVPHIRSHHYSLANAYLKSYALAHAEIAEKCKIELIMEFTEFIDETKVNQMIKRGYDLLGFSCYMWNMNEILWFTRAFKEKKPHIPVILGGPSVSYRPENILGAHPHVDMIVVGEGEIPFVHIIESMLLKNRDRPAVGGVCYLESGSCRYQPLTSPVDINTIPSPFTNGIIALDRVREVNYETYRGCIQNCHYCLWGKYKKIRFFDLARVKADLSAMLHSGSISVINYIDSAANHPPTRFMEIIDHIRTINNRNIRPIFHIDIGLLNEEVITALSKLPLGTLSLGLQSTNPKALLQANRDTRISEVSQKLELVQQADFKNVDIMVDILFGLPGDTMADIHNSIEYVFSYGFTINANILFVLPGCGYDIHADKYGLKYNPDPPYEIFSSRELSEADIKTLRRYVYILDLMKEDLIRILMIQLSFTVGIKIFDLLRLFFKKFRLTETMFYEKREKLTAMLLGFTADILLKARQKERIVFFTDLIHHASQNLENQPSLHPVKPVRPLTSSVYDFSRFNIHMLKDTIRPIQMVKR